MIIVHTAEALSETIGRAAGEGRRIGFVPTMGALHRGHISLIDASRSLTGFTVCSIFVNPTQFNNPEDLKKYPRTIEQDIDLLEAAGCDLLFLPDPSVIYPPDYKPPHYDLGELETILEGKFRPGHFQGVCQVVDILLKLVRPHALFLGEKDFQQCMVIKKLISLTGQPVDCIICPTMRETDGLAMSSRNMRLSAEERAQSVMIFKTLLFMKENIAHIPLSDLKKSAADMLESAGFRVEYAEIADASTLKSMDVRDGQQRPVGLIACHLGSVRLIDNMILL